MSISQLRIISKYTITNSYVRLCQPRSILNEDLCLVRHTYTMTNDYNKLHFSKVNALETSDPKSKPVLIVGQLQNLNKVNYDLIKVKLEPRVTKEVYLMCLASLHPAATDSCSLWLSSATIAALPSKCSRHNAPSRAHALTKIVRSCLTGKDEYIVLVCEKSDLFALTCAIARAIPSYSKKSTNLSKKRKITVEIIITDQVKNEAESARKCDGTLSHDLTRLSVISDEDVECLNNAAAGVRLAARITDMPCSEMNTIHFINEIKNVGEQVGIEPIIIQGEALNKKGFGGLYNVGKAAEYPPALVVLSHNPPGASYSIAWVGKGIVYDTGGLSIKGKSSMPGMKRDCGGAAAVLGAFYTAVKQGFKHNLYAVFCLAENAVGPKSLKPDDIITLYSGKTVEVNNTDAEGRLILGDGVAYAAKDLKADLIVDIATLTGAQGIATGRYHGALLCNDEVWEGMCVKAGRLSGDLVHPLIYCPELHFNEFASVLADMKNSSSDRSNAEVSCAGLFVGAQIGFDWPGIWLHIDMAYTVYTGERSTGYGVALLLGLFGQGTNCTLLKCICPELNNYCRIKENDVFANTPKRIKLS